MKHILKKLHLGGSSHDPSRTGEGSSAASSTAAAPPALSCASDHRRAMAPPTPQPAAAQPAEVAAPSAAPVTVEDYFVSEEEYQVQLAMAISASNTEFRNDPHNDQIRAATLLSLGRHRDDATGEEDGYAEALARRYWDYNALDYEDKVIDGFYDIFELSVDRSHHGKMPSLADIQSKVGELGFEVIVINRKIDRPLQELEQVAQCISLDCPAAKRDLLVERIAELVIDSMGGPVKDANDMLARWMERSNTLQMSMQTSLIPIGGISVGLSRHRALLFKVLADKVGIPCKLVKGSHYTGIDGDALNIIKLESGREYLVDLMAAPGTLIPADVLNTKDSSYPASQNSWMNENPPLIATDSNWVEENANGIPSNNEVLTGIETNNSHQGKPRTGKVVLSSWFSDSSQLNIGSCSKEDTYSLLSDDKSSQLLAANCASSGDKEVFDLPIPGQKKRLQVDCQLQENTESIDLFAELNPFQAKVVEKAPPPSKEAEKRGNGIPRRRENISPGGRAPLPLVWKNRSACNDLSSNKHNEVVDVGFPRKNVKGKDRNPSSSNITSSSASHGKLYPESPKAIVPRSSGVPYSHGVDMSNNEVKDLLTGDTFGGISSNDDDASLTSRINQSGSSVPTNFISRAEKSVLLLDSSDETDDSQNNTLIASTTYAQEHVRQFKGKSDKKFTHDRFMGTDASASSVVPTLARADKFDPMLDDVAGLEIAWEDLVIGERIGLGSYGEVYHADWNGTEVAVKKFLDQDFYGDALDEFLSEVRIMRRLRHPNVVLFMGAVTHPPNLSIVTEFLPRGSLYRILHRPNCQIDQKRRIKMALDVAKGMNCLHTSIPTIVHRDLKSPNLLVDKNWNVKVCDFGLSRLKHNTFLSSKSTAGTPEWMAPEVLRNEQSNEKCDVYSFGVILWELATLRMPWSGMNPMQVVGAVGFQNRRLEIPVEVDPAVAGIIRECWQQDPNLRPSFAKLATLLKPLQQLIVPFQPDPEDPQEILINSTN